MNKTLATLVLGIGALGAGCGTETYECIVGKAVAVVKNEMIYVYDAKTCPDKNVQYACSKRFPDFETRAIRVRGLNAEEKAESKDVCCILEREVDNGIFLFATRVFINAGYCTKMNQPLEAESQ